MSFRTLNNLRNDTDLALPKPKREFSKTSFRYREPGCGTAYPLKPNLAKRWILLKGIYAHKPIV